MPDTLKEGGDADGEGGVFIREGGREGGGEETTGGGPGVGGF